MELGTVCISLPQGAVDSQTQKPQKATVVMANDAVSRSLAFSTSIGKTRSGIVILLGLMLTVVPGSVVAQSSQQQQQQEQQQREQQAREQQQREQQAREEQQREEQQREQKAREEHERNERQREEERQRQTAIPPSNRLPADSPSSDSTVKTKPNAATESPVRSKVAPVDSRAQAPEDDVKTRAGENRKPPTKDQNLRN